MPLQIRRQAGRQTAKPAWLQVKEALQSSIERGELKPGEPLPGRSQLCRLFSTNRLSIDRAIAELVKEGWLVAIRGKGTFVVEPDFKHTLPTLTFAVVWSHPVTTKDNIYWGPLLRGISYAASDLEVRLLFRHCSPDTFQDLFREARVDGLIVLAPHVDDETVLNKLWRNRLPFVATSSSYEDDTLPCVDTNNFEGVRQALEHLWELGHKQIAIINLALQSTDLLQRWEAFQKLMGEAGITLDPRWTLLSTSYRWGEADFWIKRIEKWLHSVPLPTAIVAAAYDMALIVLKALQRQRIDVPQQVSLISFDDPASAAFLEPSLTTVRQPLEALGRRAVWKLYEALKKGVMPEGTELLQPELVVRQSTAPPRAEQLIVQDSKGGVSS